MFYKSKSICAAFDAMYCMLQNERKKQKNSRMLGLTEFYLPGPIPDLLSKPSYGNYIVQQQSDEETS